MIENFPNEEWRDVVGYEGLYMVSSLGRIKSFQRQKKILNQHVNRNGYLRVDLTKNKKTNMKYVARLVAMAFCENPYNKPQVDHINTIRTDNSAENLRWCTHFENMNNELSLAKRRSIIPKKRKIGWVSPLNKRISQYSLSGEFIKTHASIVSALRSIGVSGNTQLSVNQKSGMSKRYGFMWSFDEHIGGIKPYIGNRSKVNPKILMISQEGEKTVYNSIREIIRMNIMKHRKLVNHCELGSIDELGRMWFYIDRHSGEILPPKYNKL